MRYVAVSQPSPWSPMEIVGVGESMDEAYSGARAWFENAFDKFGDQRWNELVAMQNNLNAVPETVLHEKTGVTLDEWLVRLANLGQSPGTPQPPKPPLSPTVAHAPSGWELSIWILAGIFIVVRPLLSYILFIRTDLRDGELSVSISLLVVAFIVSVIIATLFAAAEFWIFRWFKEDATLQDFLFFLIILQFASMIAGRTIYDGQLLGYPIF